MSNSRSTFAKNERDRNKKARKAAKIEKRLTKDDEDDFDDEPVRVAASEPQDVIIEKLRVLHEDYENERIDDETFEETKADLLAKLTVE